MAIKYTYDFEAPLREISEKILTYKKPNKTEDDKKSQIELTNLKSQLNKKSKEIYSNLTTWQRVQISRHPNRPFYLDYIKYCCSDFFEIHGDRCIGDDNAMPGGFATFDKTKAIIIGQQKGRDTKENLHRNFGSAHPEGYRKSLRLLQMAEKFNLPFVTFIDTPGAYPGIGAEERNIAEAIARNLRDMMSAKTPIISVILGEGGSGGALGIGVADKILILENAYYSVISPEGCAAILWKHRKHAPEAAEALKLSAPELKKLQVVDQVIKEPLGGAHRDHETTALNIKKAILSSIKELKKNPMKKLLEKRYEKFRKLGDVQEK